MREFLVRVARSVKRKSPVQGGTRTGLSTHTHSTRRLLFLAPFLTEASLVGQHLPRFFFGDGRRNHGHHTGPRTAVLDNPEQFTIFSFLVEFAIGKVPRAGIQHFSGRSLAVSLFPRDN